MLSNSLGNRLNKYVSDYVVFDLETTGTSWKSDEVIEISAVKVSGGKVVDEFTSLVNPKRPIPFAASDVNGIYDDMVVDSPFFEEVLADFIDFIGDSILVGHNIHTFDLKFLNRDAFKFWGKYIGNDYVDTLTFSKQCLPGLPHYKLVDLALHYKISAAGAHRALNDCRMNQQVFEKLGKEIMSDNSNDLKKCRNCGSLLIKRKGKFGEFYGCTGYPNCKYTENI